MQFKIKNIKINAASLKKNLFSEIEKSSSIKQQAFEVAEKRAQEAKDEMLKNFETSPITREIEAGADNTFNFSSNLNGIAFGEGSLFGFIGFNESDKPIDLVRAYLEMSGKILKTAKKVKSGGRIFYEFKVKTPNITELASITPMPWESGRSWVRAIEKGFSKMMDQLWTTSMPY